jgi:hypothetical protein
VTSAASRICVRRTWSTMRLRRAVRLGLAGTRDFLEVRHRRGRPARWIESHVVAEGDLVVQFGVREDLSPGGPFRGFDLPSGVYTRDAAGRCPPAAVPMTVGWCRLPSPRAYPQQVRVETGDLTSQALRRGPSGPVTFSGARRRPRDGRSPGAAPKFG